MGWQEDVIECAGWAMRSEDLRQRFINCDHPIDFNKTVGIEDVREEMIVRTLYECLSSMGYQRDATIDLEKRYPSGRQRADLAIKGGGRGQPWKYIEVKNYSRTQGDNPVARIKDDIYKLRNRGNWKGPGRGRKHTKYLLIYRTTPDDLGRFVRNLKRLITERNISKWNNLLVIGSMKMHKFKTLCTYNNEVHHGDCEIALIRVRDR